MCSVHCPHFTHCMKINDVNINLLCDWRRIQRIVNFVTLWPWATVDIQVPENNKVKYNITKI